jgi:hypothetical protein
VSFPYGFTGDPVEIVAALVSAAFVGLVLGALAVAITAAARRR